MNLVQRGAGLCPEPAQISKAAGQNLSLSQPVEQLFPQTGGAVFGLQPSAADTVQAKAAVHHTLHGLGAAAQKYHIDLICLLQKFGIAPDAQTRGRGLRVEDAAYNGQMFFHGQIILLKWRRCAETPLPP